MPEEISRKISPIIVNLRREDLRSMLKLVQILFRLGTSAEYRRLVYPDLPEVARFDPGHAALMMGYDFHLSDQGPRLIEVNTNAGGAYIALLSERQFGAGRSALKFERFEERLLQTFAREWHDFSGSARRLQHVVLIDERPQQQPLYEEMLACRNWLQENGIRADILDPDELQITAEGVFFAGGRVDLIYNRHCDFFLETEEMASLRQAYLARTVCLSPNPCAYGLLADKRRMVLWSDPQQCAELPLSAAQRQCLLTMVPKTRMLRDYGTDQVWAERKDLILKPVTGFGSRGVLMGKSMSRKRFAEFDPELTLVQEVVPPPVLSSPDGDEYKCDIRLFVYRDHLLGIAGRVYQGQVTNMQSEGSGFASVRLV